MLISSSRPGSGSLYLGGFGVGFGISYFGGLVGGSGFPYLGGLEGGLVSPYFGGGSGPSPEVVESSMSPEPVNYSNNIIRYSPKSTEKSDSNLPSHHLFRC